MPTKDASGIDTYDNTNYSAPVHAVIGMAGFTLDKFPSEVIISIFASSKNVLYSLHNDKFIKLK